MKDSFIPRLFALVLVAMAGAKSMGDESKNPGPSSTTNTASAAELAQNDGRVATLAISDLREYEAQSPEVKRLLASALALTMLNLTYKYGSSDPQNGGMDCSGTIFYLLAKAGLADVPRDASGMYKWVWTRGRFQAVTSSSPDTFELARLKPGDLLFWSGTYQVDHDPPITHVMIYLGINRHSGRRVMVGASEGRRFNDKSRYGVSVFDFTMHGKQRASDTEPEASSSMDLKAQFIGYGSIPGLEEIDRTDHPQK